MLIFNLIICPPGFQALHLTSVCSALMSGHLYQCDENRSSGRGKASMKKAAQVSGGEESTSEKKRQCNETDPFFMFSEPGLATLSAQL